MACEKEKLIAFTYDLLALLHRHCPGLCADCVSGGLLDAAAIALADTAIDKGLDREALMVQVADRQKLLREAVEMRVRHRGAGLQ